jgi:hypothetical protein
MRAASASSSAAICYAFVNINLSLAMRPCRPKFNSEAVARRAIFVFDPTIFSLHHRQIANIFFGAHRHFISMISDISQSRLVTPAAIAAVIRSVFSLVVRLFQKLTLFI